MEDIEKELDQVITNFSDLREDTDLVLNRLLSDFEKVKEFVFSDESDAPLNAAQVGTIKETLDHLKQELKIISIKHRRMHSSVTKVGKAIEKNCVSDFKSIARPDFIENEENKNMINKVIAHHYYTHGYEEVAVSLMREANLPNEGIFDDGDFTYLYKIFREILAHNLQPALEFGSEYSAELELISSNLEFKLHIMAFSEILKKGMSGQLEAIAYARNNFAKFSKGHEKEIQKLMAALVYIPTGIENSPYKYLLSHDRWIELSYLFLKDSCSMLGRNKESALSVVVEAAFIGMPALLNLEKFLPTNWLERDELPIDFNLQPDYQFHSTFVCPILKQVTNDDNPPMRLSCGHAISKNALTEITNGEYLHCPYCFLKQRRNMAKEITF